MKTIKIIDLIVDIANRKEVPKTIKYQNHVYIYEEYDEMYYIEGNPDNYSLFSEFSYSSLTALISFLNDEIEIIEDTPKCDLPQHTCDLPQYKVLKENKKIENLKYRSHCGGTFQEEQKYRNERDDEITNKINEIIKKIQGE